MTFDPEIFLGFALGLGLSASCGFRVFIPMLITGLAGHFGWMHMADNLKWLASWPAIICFSAAAIIEVLAYYIPVVDNFLDTIATPSSVVAGTLVSASAFVHLDPSWQWVLALIIGGGSAGLIQEGTGLTRLGTTKMTAGTANHVLASTENTAATGVPILALLAPVFAAFVAIFLIFLVSFTGYRFFVKKSK